jgi:hypothetical protein
MMSALKQMNTRTVGAVSRMLARLKREREFLLNEVLQVKGLMPILMKPRNNERWSDEDKAAIRARVKRLSSLSPYLIVVILPGGIFLLPLLSWWLDRRRNRHAATAAR